MISGVAISVILVAAVIASAGLLWFRAVLKDRLLAMSKNTRFGLYALIWLAYFIPVVILAGQPG